MAKALGMYPAPYSDTPNKKDGLNYRIKNFPIANKKYYIFYAIHKNGLSEVAITEDDIHFDDDVDFRDILVNKYRHQKEQDKEINIGNNKKRKITP